MSDDPPEYKLAFSRKIEDVIEALKRNGCTPALAHWLAMLDRRVKKLEDPDDE